MIDVKLLDGPEGEATGIPAPSERDQETGS